MLSVDGQVLQEAQAGHMIHSLWESIEYRSSITTLFPGDVINHGTSGGTMAGSADTRSGFLQPPGGTGARLPPVNTYRD